MNLFHKVCMQCSSITTQQYSSSFSSAIKLLHKDVQGHICAIYGFVRFADEIVDTFHAYNKRLLLAEFKRDSYAALERGISTNPIINSFQLTVNKFNINHRLIDAFFNSMERDLEEKQHTLTSYQDYIYGSAEAVGLMCLYVFCEGNQQMYDRLSPNARSLGSAFQKVNFLRDIKNDFEGLERMYFPGCDFKSFSAKDKRMIEHDIKKDFENAYAGVIQLPTKVRFGVYVAFKYYQSLFKKICKAPPQKILKQRVRVANYHKLYILAKAGMRRQLNMF